MKVPKQIEKELAARGWTMVEGEKWRYVRGLDWACAYFNYKSKCCLITVGKATLEYYIEILYKFPICSSYILRGKKFDVQLRKK